MEEIYISYDRNYGIFFNFEEGCIEERWKEHPETLQPTIIRYSDIEHVEEQILKTNEKLEGLKKIKKLSESQADG